jgi:superfamily II DNA/RNA helicase
MDEADRMVNLGFEADLTFILDKLPSEAMEGEDQGEQMDVDGETMVKKGRNRVTTLFSATMPPPVERLAKKYLKKPAIITIGEAGRAVDTVEQNVEFVQGDEKKKWVVYLSPRVEPKFTSFISGNGCWRFSTVATMLRLSSFSSTRRRRRIWLPRIFPVLG